MSFYDSKGNFIQPRSEPKNKHLDPPSPLFHRHGFRSQVPTIEDITAVYEFLEQDYEDSSARAIADGTGLHKHRVTNVLLGLGSSGCVTREKREGGNANHWLLTEAVLTQ